MTWLKTKKRYRIHCYGLSLLQRQHSLRAQIRHPTQNGFLAKTPYSSSFFERNHIQQLIDFKQIDEDKSLFGRKKNVSGCQFTTWSLRGPRNLDLGHLERLKSGRTYLMLRSSSPSDLDADEKNLEPSEQECNFSLKHQVQIEKIIKPKQKRRIKAKFLLVSRCSHV